MILRELFLKRMEENKKLQAATTAGTGGSGVGTSNAVQYIPQTLTEEQQMQARANMGLYRSEVGEILPETTVEIDPETGLCYLATSHGLEVGKSYTVTWNGTKYECVGQFLPIQDPETGAHIALVALGNSDMASGGDGTGEPFVILGNNDAKMVGVTTFDGSTAAVMKIMGEVVSKIPEKYITNQHCVIPITTMTKDSEKAHSSITMDTTELVTALQNDYPVYLDLTAVNDGAHKMVKVIDWQSFAPAPLDFIVGVNGASAVNLYLWAHTHDLSSTYTLRVDINITD